MTTTTEPTAPPADAATGQAGGLDAMPLRYVAEAFGSFYGIPVIETLGQCPDGLTIDEIAGRISAKMGIPRPMIAPHAVVVSLIRSGIVTPPDGWQIGYGVPSGSAVVYRLNRPGLASFAAAISALGAGTIGGGE